MKTILLALLLAFTGSELLAQIPAPAPTTPGTGIGRTRQPRYPQPLPAPAAAPTAPATSAPPEETIPPGLIDFSGVDVNQVLDVYAKLVNRTILRAALPEAKIVLKTQTPLTRSEAIQALQAVLALNNISVVNIGDKFVKAVTSDAAQTAGGLVDRSGTTNLPDLGTYITHITQLKYIKPSLMVPLITPFGKLPNSVFPIDDNGILVIRDYAENVKRMLEMIDQIDVSVPAEYISEVIPIRYAKVDEIASALNSLGGSGGGSTVSIGQGASSAPISGLGNRASGGLGGGGGSGGGFGGNNYQQGGLGGRAGGAATPNGTPAAGTSFQSRLQNIINKASGPTGGGGAQDQIQLFGQTKIIPNESSSTLLIYATRQDMTMIKEIISKLDVPLAQVLIEAVIMNVTIGNTFKLGVSASQNPTSLGGNILGGGGFNNGNQFQQFIKTVTTTTNALGAIESVASSVTSSGGSNVVFGNNLPGGLSYFGNIGPNYDVAIQAAESDSHASIIQRPRIQTSQAKPAQFFVGSTVPYVTGTYYNGGYGGGNSSQYAQLSVGVELDVTPFINPDGEVSMDIVQNIDDVDGFTKIDGNDVPKTLKRTLSSSITVRDRDTVMLGGFIKSDKSTSKSGVPFLSDIPLLGNLFTSRSDSKGRSELIVLMRPTVLKTPELAARNTIKETQRLPGVSAAAAGDADYEHKLVEAERKRELRNAKNGSNTNGFFNVLTPMESVSNTNVPAAALENQTPATMPDPTPASTTVDPAGAALERARADFQKKSAEMEAVRSAAQKKKLDALLNDRMTGKISDD
ncbi:MAG: putative ral secretion pathway protein, partial [Verrucomicrobiota bacterium]